MALCALLGVLVLAYVVGQERAARVLTEREAWTTLPEMARSLAALRLTVDALAAAHQTTRREMAEVDDDVHLIKRRVSAVSRDLVTVTKHVTEVARQHAELVQRLTHSTNPTTRTVN